MTTDIEGLNWELASGYMTAQASGLPSAPTISPKYKRHAKDA